LSQFCAKAKTWLEAASSDANRIVALEAAIESERARSRRLEDKLEVLIARINATEGTDWKYEKEVEEAPSNVDKIEEEIAAATKSRRKRRG
jgi:chromosome segregation ATPase